MPFKNENTNLGKFYHRPSVLIPWLLSLSLLIVIIVANYPIPDFEISANPNSSQIAPGGSGLVIASVSTVNRYSEPIDLSISGNLEDIDFRFVPRNSAGSFNSRILLDVSQNAQVGNRTLEVSARSSSGRTKIVEFELNVVIGNSEGIDGDDGLASQSELLRAWSDSVQVVPYDELKYADLFGGIGDTVFTAFGAPWQVEGDLNSVSFRSALQVHKNRYENSVRSRYLFTTRDSLERALVFWSELEKVSDFALEDVIEARYLEVANVSPYFYWGSEIAVSIIYPQPFLVSGQPNLVFRFEENDQINSSLRAKFQLDWSSAARIDIAQAISEISDN